MTNEATLCIDISSYWHHGTGKAAGPYADALVERDRDGLPFVAGRMLKGLLRDAMQRCAEWQVLLPPATIDDPKLCVNNLFGTRSDSDPAKTQARFSTYPGLLHFTDAKLPAPLQAYLAQDNQECAQLREALYTTHYSTAINASTGTAETHSLRGLEVSVPLQLHATIEYVVGPQSHHSAELKTSWHELLQQTFPLVRAVGAQRNRGFGRCQLSWHTGAEATQ